MQKKNVFTSWSWDGERLKVGCHSIAIGEIKRFAALMGWTDNVV